jgi:hypothetical protein
VLDVVGAEIPIHLRGVERFEDLIVNRTNKHEVGLFDKGIATHHPAADLDSGRSGAKAQLTMLPGSTLPRGKLMLSHLISALPVLVLGESLWGRRGSVKQVAPFSVIG